MIETGGQSASMASHGPPGGGVGKAEGKVSQSAVGQLGNRLLLVGRRAFVHGTRGHCTFAHRSTNRLAAWIAYLRAGGRFKLVE